MSQSLIPVILAGGKGERFWPLSRTKRPKQFLSLDGSGRSLLQATADRLLDLAGGWSNLWVITSALIAEGVETQLPDLPSENLLVEPEGKDTAPAVAWASLEVAKRFGEDAVIGFFPADHWIGDQQLFQATLHAASELAATAEAIVTLGISPDYPSTGYGYIEQAEMKGTFGNLPVYKVNRFTEKPDRPTAESFLQSGAYSWNSGMFIFRAGVILNELRQHAPSIISLLETKGKDAYFELPKISIDYALMEKTSLAYVLPTSFGWDDLGDWNALARLLQGDSDNVSIGEHLADNTHNCLVYAEDNQQVIVTIGVEDLVIVRDGPVTLVVNKEHTQSIKQVLKSLQSNPKFSNLL